MALKSLAIIPDGNRRFAKSNRFGYRKAYAKGFEKVEELLEWAEPTKIERIGFWALSLENYQQRSQRELTILFSLMKRHLRKAIADKKYKKKGVRVEFFGKLELLPKHLRQLMKELEHQTQNGKRVLSIAVAYSGREELLRAAKLIAVHFGDRAGQAKESDFTKYLYMQHSPDLIIRTGDVSRLSGFMPWQTAYSELYFSKKLWPSFTKDDFRDAMAFFDETQRRFGR
ncbi:di-trans,poly-cis-decaprenylcistransferase [Candidatus Micrarchaeota archaeon]|nr:di-trans,poly-cis-decaprenylcistransferase [Candidatus Micrarchaeota archaeon]